MIFFLGAFYVQLLILKLLVFRLPIRFEDLVANAQIFFTRCLNNLLYRTYIKKLIDAFNANKTVADSKRYEKKFLHDVKSLIGIK